MNMRYLLSFLTWIVLAGPTTVRADSYKIDPVHSTILFKINHFGVGNIYGRFDSFSGYVTFDQDDPSKDAVDIQIKTDSVDTNALDRDKNLKGPDFFNAKQFPTATFKGKSFEKIDDKTYEIMGDFTLRGVTEPLTLKTRLIGSGPGPKGESRTGAEATTTLKERRARQPQSDVRYFSRTLKAKPTSIASKLSAVLPNDGS